MNTPSDEMLSEAMNCIKKQNNNEKWDVLYPLSIQHGFTVSQEQIVFKRIFPNDNCTGNVCVCTLPFESIFGTFISGGFLYIWCCNGEIYVLDGASNLWRLYLPITQLSLLTQLRGKFHELAEHIRCRLLRRKK